VLRFMADRNQIRVLHVAETCKGGVGSAIRDIANGSSSDRIVHRVLHPVEHPIPGLSKAVSTVTFNRGERGVHSLWRLRSALLADVAACRPHVIHAHSTFAGLIVRLAMGRRWLRRKIAIIYTAHGWSFDRPGRQLSNLAYASVESVLGRLCDRVICLSKHELLLARKARISADKIRVIYNGHPRLTDIARPMRPPTTEYRVLFVGRFDYQKGFDILLESMDLLAHTDIRFTVIGEAVRGCDKKTFIPEGVEALGWQSPDVVYEHMRKATVLVVPSRWEGFALAPLEAMSLGTPVLSSGASSLPEAVVEGVSGKRFDSGTARELAAILQATPVAEWQALGAKAEAFCREVFSPDAMLAATYQLYSEVTP
jgi:glycosyltransferase involved in cell wall biosynthesis